MSTYLDSGFDDNLTRSAPISDISEVDLIGFDQFTPQVGGNKITTGEITSKGSKQKWNLENETFIGTNNTVDQFLIGKKADGKIGYELRDNNNNLLVDDNGVYTRAFLQQFHRNVGGTTADHQLRLQGDFLSGFKIIDSLTIPVILTVPSLVILNLAVLGFANSGEGRFRFRIDGSDPFVYTGGISKLIYIQSSTRTHASIMEFGNLAPGSHLLQIAATATASFFQVEG